MADGFDDLQMVISLDASGVETGLNKVSQGVSKLDADLAKLGTGVGFGAGVSAEADKAEQGLKGLGDEAQQTSDKLAKVGTGFDLSAFGAQLDNASSKMQSFGAGLTVLAAPFELVGALSVKAFSDFEAGMGKIFTLLPDISQDAMADMSQQIKEFSTTFAADISTVQQSAYDALSAGISGEDLFPFLETAQKAAIAGSSDVGVAVNGLTSAMNAYQMSVDESGRVSDVFFKTVELGKIEFDTLSDYIGKVTPTASALGVSLEDVGAGIAAITAVNPNASEAMTSLKSLFKDLATGGSDLDKLFQQLAGQSFKNFIASGGSLADAMSLINDYMQQSGTDAFNLTGNFESANAIAMLTGTNFGRLADFTDKVANSAGATDTAYSKLSGTLDQSLNALKSQFQVMSIEIGEKLAPSVQEFTKFLSENADDISQFAQNVASSAVPALEAVFDILKKGMDAFNGMSPETRSMLAKILGIGAVGAAVGGPALFAAGTVLSPIASLVTLMGGLTSASTVATGALGGVSTEVGLLAGAGTGATASIGGISGVLAALGPAGIAAAAGIAVAGAAYATNFGGFADNVNEAIGLATKSLEDFSKGDYESAGENMAKSVAKGFESVGDLIVDVIKNIPEFAIDAEKLFKGFKEGMKEVGQGVGEALREKTEEYINGASVSVEGFKSAIAESIKSYDWGNVGADIGKLIGDGLDAVTPDVSGYVDSMKSSIKSGDWSPVGEAIGDIISIALKSKLGISSEFVGDVVGSYVTTQPGATPTTTTVPKSSVTYASAPGVVAIPTGVSASSLQYAGVTKPSPVLEDAQKQYEQLKQDENAAIKTWLEGMGKYNEDVDKYRTIFEKNNSEWGNKMKDASAAIGATTDTIKTKTKELQTFSSAQAAASAGLKPGEEFVMNGEVMKLAVKEGVIQGQATSAEGIAREQQAAISKKQQEEALKEQQAAQKKYDDAIISAAEKRKDAEQSYNDKLADAAKSRDRAIADLDMSDKDYAKKRANIEEKYNDAVDDAKTARERKERDISDSISKLSGDVKAADSAFKSASASTSKYTTAQNKSIQELRDILSKTGGRSAETLSYFTDAQIMDVARAEGLLDGVNAELGESVQQLTSISSTVRDISSVNAFESIKNQFTDLQNQFDTGKISQDQYLDNLRKLSAQTDTLSRSTNTLKGDQREAILSFEREIKESLRRISAGTYGEEPLSTIRGSVGRLGSTQFKEEPAQISKVNDLIDGYKKQNVEQGKAAALQFKINDILSDGNVTLAESIQYLANYNRVVGDTSDVSIESAKVGLEYMRTLQDANVLQKLLSDAMLDGGISTEELAGIQAQQAIVAQDLTSVTGPVPAALQSVADAIDALMQRASDAASRAVASANEATNAAEAKASGIVRAGQILKGPTPTGYASGGTVRKTGPALVHEGEYVLNRNDVNDIKRIPQASSNPVSANVNIDMRGATITNSVAQDIPRQVARAQRLALGRVGA